MARAPQGDNDPMNPVQVAINIAAVAAGLIMTLVWMFYWAHAETALAFVFVAALLMFIIPIVIFARSLEKHGPENGGHGG